MIRRDELSEYVRGSLWELPTLPTLSVLSVLVAPAAGSLLSAVSIGSRSALAFQETADDARGLLIGITGTMVTVMALLLATSPSPASRPDEPRTSTTGVTRANSATNPRVTPQPVNCNGRAAAPSRYGRECAVIPR